MKKSDVIEFFDRYAPSWDADQIDKTPIINRIFDNAGIGPGQHILDVACGTGLLFSYYLQRNVATVTGIDISHEMAKLAAQKHQNIPNITVICGDVEETVFDRKYDQVMVYNAFPHFPDPERLIGVLAGLVEPGGRVTVAHGASREAIDNHHSGAASKVSNGLMTAQDLKALFEPWFEVDVMISNQQMYQVSGVKKDTAAHMHTHSHGHGVHSHSHDHHHHHGHSHSVPAPQDETAALLRYMVQHNSAHAQELCDLAQKLKAEGNPTACKRIMDAVSNFDVGNTILDALLQDWTKTE